MRRMGRGLGMARKPKRPCSFPMCLNLTHERYCNHHADKAKQDQEEREKERHRRYDHLKRDQKAATFYKSKAWERARQQALMRDHGLCQHCLREKRIASADMVHHIKPVRLFWDLRLVLSNLVSLCNRCHAKIDHKSQK